MVECLSLDRPLTVLDMGAACWKVQLGGLAVHSLRQRPCVAHCSLRRIALVSTLVALPLASRAARRQRAGLSMASHHDEVFVGE